MPQGSSGWVRARTGTGTSWHARGQSWGPIAVTKRPWDGSGRARPGGHLSLGARRCLVAGLLSLELGASALASPGDHLWTKRYDGPANRDIANAIAVSPDGRRVFVTGESEGSGTGSDFATVAYRGGTGAKLWTKRYDGPANGVDGPNAIAVSPDGRRVFVTGGSDGSGTGSDYATVAYRAGTGARLWTRRYDGPANSVDYAVAIAVSPDGTKLFVTGGSDGSGTGSDYATVAYRAGTGARLWTRRYDGPATDFDWAWGIAVSPGGRRVFVTGESWGSATRYDYATLAYRAGTGARLWTTRYDGPANGDDNALAIAVSPGGTKVFVTGESWGSASLPDYATVAYWAGTGARLWTRRYEGPANGYDGARAIAVSPDGRRVFVTGATLGTASYDYATVAYRAGTGARLWTRRYDPSNVDIALAIAVSSDGTKVFVTGESEGSVTGSDYATVAYSAV